MSELKLTDIRDELRLIKELLRKILRQLRGENG